MGKSKLLIADNTVEVITEFKIPELKNILLEFECKYKLKNVFLNKYFNESFAILSLETFYFFINSLLKEKFMDIEYDTDITFKGETAYISLKINKFYDKEFVNSKKEDLEFLFNTKLTEVEKYIIEDFLEKFPTTENINEKIKLFLSNIIDFDEIIKKIKENLNTELTSKEQLNFLELELLKELFGINLLKIITDNQIKDDKEYEYRG